MKVKIHMQREAQPPILTASLINPLLHQLKKLLAQDHCLLLDRKKLDNNAQLYLTLEVLIFLCIRKFNLHKKTPNRPFQKCQSYQASLNNQSRVI